MTNKEEKQQRRLEKEEYKRENALTIQADKSISKSVLDFFPIVEHSLSEKVGVSYTLKDGTRMAMFQLFGNDLTNATDDEIQRMLYTDTLFYRKYKTPFKMFSSKFPMNTDRYQKQLEQLMEKEENEDTKKIIYAKLRSLEALEEDTSNKEYFFMAFAKDKKELVDCKDKLFASSLRPAFIAQEKAEHILWQLNNMHKQLTV